MPRARGSEHWGVGNFASQDLDICLHISCGRFAGNYEDLRGLSCSPVRWPKSIAEICGDDESAQKLRGGMSKSCLAEFPIGAGCASSFQQDIIYYNTNDNNDNDNNNNNNNDNINEMQYNIA